MIRTEKRLRRQRRAAVTADTFDHTCPAVATRSGPLRNDGEIHDPRKVRGLADKFRPNGARPEAPTHVQILARKAQRQVKLSQTCMKFCSHSQLVVEIPHRWEAGTGLGIEMEIADRFAIYVGELTKVDWACRARGVLCGIIATASGDGGPAQRGVDGGGDSAAPRFGAASEASALCRQCHVVG